MSDVTFVVPTYNRSKFLRRTLLSVQCQTRVDFMVYVVDDGSSDNTSMIVDEFASNDDRFVYFRNIQRKGSMANTKYAISLVTTKYFCYLADDDLVMPNFLEESLLAFNDYPSAAFYSGMSICIDNQGNPFYWSGPNVESGYLSNPSGAEVIWKYGWPQQAATLYSTDKYLEVGGMLEIAGFDLELLTRLAFFFPIVLSTVPIAFFTINDDSVSSRRSVNQHYSDWLYIKDSIESYQLKDETPRNAVLESWDRRVPNQIRMSLMQSFIICDKVDVKLGIDLLGKMKEEVWTTSIIIVLFYLFPIRFCSVLFRIKKIIFMKVRICKFYFFYRRQFHFWLGKTYLNDAI